MPTPTGPLLAAILFVADRQRGLITHAQLTGRGLGRDAIKRLRDQGWLRTVHRGVYLVGHAAPVPWRRETAALLAYTPHSVIVHRSALMLCGICIHDESSPVHVAVRNRNPHPITGVIVHSAPALQDSDIGRVHGLPATKPARALLEAACDLGLHETERAVDEALALGLVTRPGLLAVLRRYPRHRGARIIRTLADPARASAITASEAEAAYGVLLRKAGAPPSRTQYPVGPYRVDRCWPELRLVVEIDGVQFHRDGKRMEQDNRRQDDIRHLGLTTVRFTRRQVVHEPLYVMFRTGQEIGAAQARAAGWS